MVKCDDPNCPIHGELATRGMVLEGTVASDKMDKAVVVKRDYSKKIRKYERFTAKKSKILAHNPPCINAKKGDQVRIAECRKISPQKSFAVIEKLKEEKG